MIMNGWMKRYKESMERTGEPIMLSQCPKVEMDLPGMVEYAKRQGKKVTDLTEDEKKAYIR